MQKIILGVIALLIIGGGALFFMGGTAQAPGSEELENAGTAPSAQEVPAGTYTIDAAQSKVEWAAKKPLIEGYVNSGTIDIKEGTLTVGEGIASGSIVMDMDTLHVGLTAKKPGKEGALEGHLKKDDFFDVAKYPTAEFVIRSVAEKPDSAATKEYTITGDLTMKGTTGEVSFPAKVYMEEGVVHAVATFEIDRTKWGITYNSGNFFDDLGDSLIDDMVALSLSIVATSAAQ